MVSAVLSARDISIVSLGAEVPIDQIRSAADRFCVDTVGITFSSAYQYNQIRDDINELRELISDDVDIWVGGEGVRRLRKLPVGVTKFKSLDNL